MGAIKLEKIKVAEERSVLTRVPGRSWNEIVDIVKSDMEQGHKTSVNRVMRDLIRIGLLHYSER